MSLEKLKDAARKFEQKEDWRKAIEAYLKAIQQIESGKDAAPDLSLYNRVGDLYLKVSDTASAVRHYERAVDLYADQGFFNNAIALCGKILRVNPGRTLTYLKLAQLHARKNVVIEAKRNLLEYLERMNAQGQLDEAFGALKSFADQFSSSQDIRVMLIELLRAASRTDEAREQLEKLSAELEARGDVAGARTTRERLEAVATEEPGHAPEPPRVSRPGDLVFLDTGFGLSATAEPAAPARDTDRPPLEGLIPEGLLLIEPPADADAGPSADLSLIQDAATDFDSVEVASSGETFSGFQSTAIEGSVVEMDADEAAPLETTPLDPSADFESGPIVQDVTPLDGLILEVATAEASAIDFAAVESVDFESVQLGELSEAALDLEPTGADAVEPPRESAEPEVDLSDVLAESLTEPVPPVDEGAPTHIVDLDLIEPEELPPETVGAESSPDGTSAATPLPPHEMGVAASVGTPASASESLLSLLEHAVADRPDDPSAHRALADELLREGETERAVYELELAASGYETREAWADAGDVITQVVALQPDDIRHYQKLVELAYRTGSRTRLIEAYLALGDALVRMGETDKAIAVYGRVTDHDPENLRAHLALAGLQPAMPKVPPAAPPAEAIVDQPAAASAPPPAAPPSTPRPAGDFVDLGSLVLEEGAPRDTRMRIAGAQPTHDEQRDFEEMLAEFKRGIERNIDVEDYQAHYELGVAFKEMGLLDEAIAEFQKALRAPEGRLRTSEALGVAFFDKQQFGIAETVLRRAVDTLEGGDDAKIGLLYWLGRASEAQGKVADSLASYERALAVDIRFMDIGDRVQRLAAGRGQ
jgi:tetratricopeptide (TPR) repeat protein